jgi:hypothetical protein
VRRVRKRRTSAWLSIQGLMLLLLFWASIINGSWEPTLIWACWGLWKSHWNLMLHRDPENSLHGQSLRSPLHLITLERPLGSPRMEHSNAQNFEVFLQREPWGQPRSLSLHKTGLIQCFCMQNLWNERQFLHIFCNSAKQQLVSPIIPICLSYVPLPTSRSPFKQLFTPFLHNAQV